MAAGAWSRAVLTGVVAVDPQSVGGNPFGSLAEASNKTAPYDSTGLQALQNQIDEERKK